MAALAPTLALFLLVCMDRALHLCATGGTSSFSEGACDEPPNGTYYDSCASEFFQQPPVGSLHRNLVNVSWVIMDVDKMDETAGTTSVRSDIQMWWLDCRWPNLIERRRAWYCQNTTQCEFSAEFETELRAMAGSALMWSEGASYVVNYWHECSPPSSHFWTPVPKELLPNSADNTKSATEAEIYIKNLNYLRSGLSTALLLDESPVRFTYNFDYTMYPFDEQVMDLELKFDMFAAPELTTTILDDDGSTEGTLRDLNFISTRSDVSYEASAISPHLSQTTVEAFSKKGWRVLGAEVNRVEVGNVWRLRFRINIARNWLIIVPRFFVPVLFLALISFAAFFLPLNQVMPRVAVGFVSFLSLAVFRSQAYNMLPNKPTNMVWLDVVMLTITEIMWIALILNIVALVVDGKYSLHGARFVDKVVCAVFPFTSLVMLIMLFVLGMAGLDPVAIMIWTNIVLASSLVFMSVIIARFLCRLPQVLLRILAKELTNRKLVWKDGIHLQPRELAEVFRFLDEDGEGEVTTDEVIQGFEKSGLTFESDEHREVFRSVVGKSNESGGPSTSSGKFQIDRELGLDEFRDHFKGFLGGALVRRLHQHASNSAKDLSI